MTTKNMHTQTNLNVDDRLDINGDARFISLALSVSHVA